MANLFETKLGKLFPALGQLQKAGVTDEMWERIGKSDGEYARVVYEALMTKMSVDASSNPETETVTVPDLPAAELIALVRRSFEEAGIPLIYFNPDLQAWDLLLDERGKTFQVLRRKFGRGWDAREARAWQKSVGADGNVASFIAWVIVKKPTGWFVSIPNDDSRLWRRSVSSDLFVPRFYRHGAHRRFDLSGVQGKWSGYGSVVAFRTI